MSTWVLIGEGALATAGLGIGIAYAIEAKSAANDADKLRAAVIADSDHVPERAICSQPDGRPALRDELSQTLDTHYAPKTIAIGGFTAAGLFAVGIGVTYWLWPSSDRRDGGALLAPLSVPGARGFELRARF